jgi:hypothetical protein
MSHSPTKNSSTGTPTHAETIQTQMDVLNAVVNMIHQPRVMLYAQEALLVALNMCDKRVDRFVLHHTRLVEEIVKDLCKRFQAALDAANESLATPSVLYSGSAVAVNSTLSVTSTVSGRQQTPITAAPAAAASATGTGSSLLSPLTKLSSFSLGSSTKASTQTPQPSAAPSSISAKLKQASSFYSPASFTMLRGAAGGAGTGANGTAHSGTAENAAAPVPGCGDANAQATGHAEVRSSPMQVSSRGGATCVRWRTA